MSQRHEMGQERGGTLGGRKRTQTQQANNFPIFPCHQGNTGYPPLASISTSGCMRSSYAISYLTMAALLKPTSNLVLG